CGTAMVPAAYVVGARLAGVRAGVVLAALTAFSPLLVWYSQEARPYILLALLTALATVAFLRCLQRWRGRDLAWWSVLCVLALATDPPGELFLTAAAALVALVGVWLAVARTEPPERRAAALAGGLGLIAVVGVVAAGLVGVDYLNTRNMIETWLPLAGVPAIGVPARRVGW